MEFALGAANNYPEENCCVCGKPKGIYIYLNLYHKIDNILVMISRLFIVINFT